MRDAAACRGSWASQAPAAAEQASPPACPEPGLGGVYCVGKVDGG